MHERCVKRQAAGVCAGKQRLVQQPLQALSGEGSTPGSIQQQVLQRTCSQRPVAQLVKSEHRDAAACMRRHCSRGKAMGAGPGADANASEGAGCSCTCTYTCRQQHAAPAHTCTLDASSRQQPRGGTPARGSSSWRPIATSTYCLPTCGRRTSTHTQEPWRVRRPAQAQRLWRAYPCTRAGCQAALQATAEGEAQHRWVAAALTGAAAGLHQLIQPPLKGLALSKVTWSTHRYTPNTQRPTHRLVAGPLQQAPAQARLSQASPFTGAHTQHPTTHRLVVGQLQEALVQVFLPRGGDKVEAAVVVRQLAVIGLGLHVVHHALVLRPQRAQQQEQDASWRRDTVGSQPPSGNWWAGALHTLLVDMCAAALVGASMCENPPA